MAGGSCGLDAPGATGHRRRSPVGGSEACSDGNPDAGEVRAELHDHVSFLWSGSSRPRRACTTRQWLPCEAPVDPVAARRIGCAFHGGTAPGGIAMRVRALRRVVVLTA